MERAVFRIIDANFNRAREATRLMEEYCRFALNSSELSNRAKTLRHRICDTVARLDANIIITARNVHTDVGRGMTVQGQLVRRNLQDCFTAAAKRLTEALRVLAETTQTLKPDVAKVLEQLRFDAYSLEKDTLTKSSTAKRFSSVRLYVLINATAGSTDSQILRLSAACVAGGADCIQLRAKGIIDKKTYELAGKIVILCKKAGVISIVNDRVDIAAAVGADGVHLGQDDLPLEQGRKLQLEPMIFGISTHSIDQLKSAIDQRPDYVSLGPAFATGTKPGAAPAGPKYINDAMRLLADTAIGHVAIGGITVDNIEEVIRAGAKNIAVCAAVSKAADPEAMCRSLKDKVISIKA